MNSTPVYCIVYTPFNKKTTKSCLDQLLLYLVGQVTEHLGIVAFRTLNHDIEITIVADPFHFDKDPDPRIQSGYDLKQKNTNFFYNFFLLITQKIIYYCMNIENFNSNEKNLNNDLFMYLR